MISPEDKAKILSDAMDRAKRIENKQQLSANVSEQKVADSLTKSDSPSEEGPSADGTSDDNMEANVSKGKNSHSGDLRRMMGKQPPRSSKRTRLALVGQHQSSPLF